MKVYLAMPKDSALTKMFFSDEVMKKLESSFDVTYCSGTSIPDAGEFKKNAGDCDVVITGWGHPLITAEMLTATNIKLIAHTGGSVGSLTGGDVYDAGVRVISGNLLYAESVAEGVIAYILMGLRKIPHHISYVKDGGWYMDSAYNTKGLLGETIGLVGFGTITKFLIEMLQAFRVNIMLYSAYPPDREYCNKYNITLAGLDEIFEKCKIVSLHSAMNERTRGMIGKKQFGLLSDGALFVNTARGNIVKEDEMVEALRENRFSAVLDVYSEEPLKPDSPLRSLDNVYSIPHLAGPTIDRRPYITSALIDNIIKFGKGEPMELEITRDMAARMTVGG